jgi:death-on-curing protein
LPNTEPEWLEIDDVDALAAEAVFDSGEVYFLRDHGLLESAVYRPRFRWHYEDEEDVVSLAVTLGVGIAKNHAYEQGNKRAGFAAMLMFLERNGYLVEAPDHASVAETFTQVIDGTYAEWDFTEDLREFVFPFGDAAND